MTRKIKNTTKFNDLDIENQYHRLQSSKIPFKSVTNDCKNCNNLTKELIDAHKTVKYYENLIKKIVKLVEQFEKNDNKLARVELIEGKKISYIPQIIIDDC